MAFFFFFLGKCIYKSATFSIASSEENDRWSCLSKGGYECTRQFSRAIDKNNVSMVLFVLGEGGEGDTQGEILGLCIAQDLFMNALLGLS